MRKYWMAALCLFLALGTACASKEPQTVIENGEPSPSREWRIEADESYDTKIGQDSVWLDAEVRLASSLRKQGGSTPAGDYTGTMECSVDYDGDAAKALVNKLLSGSGKVISLTRNETALPVSEVTVTLAAADTEQLASLYDEYSLESTGETPVYMGVGELPGDFAKLSVDAKVEIMGMTVEKTVSGGGATGFLVELFEGGGARVSLLGAKNVKRGWIDGNYRSQ